MPSNTKEAEKAYLRRVGSGAWERTKPFSPPGTDTVRDSVRLMHDFAVAVSALDVTPAHRVLDLGSGTGWTSEWLRRLNLRVVSLDISIDMLRVGQSRPGGVESPFVAADLEALPFRSGAFDRAICLNALHHVPDPLLALREVFRVLNDEGQIVLIEPGSGHAANAVAQAAMQDFGVLEQDLEATALMQYCRDAGFPHVSVRPLSYMTGELSLSLDELTRWRRWSRTKRPVRALAKLRRTLLEMAGLGKDGELFEDALSMTASRILMRHLQEQAVVVAGKQVERRSREHRATIEVDPSGLRLREGLLTGTLRIRNIGNVTWSSKGRPGAVQVGGQLLDANLRLVDRDRYRVSLPLDVAPGADCTVRIEMPVPDAGAHHVKFDLVAEGVTWFEAEGSRPLVIPVPGEIPDPTHFTAKNYRRSGV